MDRLHIKLSNLLQAEGDSAGRGGPYARGQPPEPPSGAPARLIPPRPVPCSALRQRYGTSLGTDSGMRAMPAPRAISPSPAGLFARQWPVAAACTG